MPQNTVVRARISADVKEKAAVVLETMGLTVSDAFRMMMVRIATEKALPFDPLIPNEETIAAMGDARAGRGKRFESVEDLMRDLRADD